MPNEILIGHANRFDMGFKAVQPRKAESYSGPARKAIVPEAEKKPPFPLEDVAETDPTDRNRRISNLRTILHVNPKKFTAEVIAFAKKYQATKNHPLFLYLVHDDLVTNPTEMGIFGNTVTNTIHRGFKQGKDFVPGEELNYQTLIDTALQEASLKPGSIKILVTNSNVAKTIIAADEAKITNGQNLVIWENGQAPKIIIGKNWDDQSKIFRDGLETIGLETVKIPLEFTDNLNSLFKLLKEDVKPAENLAELLNPEYMIRVINKITRKLAKELNPKTPGQLSSTLSLDSFTNRLVDYAKASTLKSTEFDQLIEKIKQSALLKTELTDIERFKSLVESKDELAEVIFKFINAYINQALKLIKLPNDAKNLVEPSNYFSLVFSTNPQEAKKPYTMMKPLPPLDPRAEFGGAKYLAMMHQKSLGKI